MGRLRGKSEFEPEKESSFCQSDKELPVLYKQKEDCCGCSACASVCPTGSIRMEADEEGFLYPSVDAETCIRCGRCLKACAFKADPEKQAGKAEGGKIDVRAFAARAKDRGVLEQSSSGGIFTVLSDWIFRQEGAAACAVYHEETCRAEFELITDASTRDRARGSKYMQSIPGTIFCRCLAWLKENPGKMLLFVGMGCQTAGFGHFIRLHGLADRVILVDIICHGSPSPRIWEEYVHHEEKRLGGKAREVRFKDKRKGWLNPTAVMKIDGKEHSLDPYVRLFYSRCILRPSCHKCPYASVHRDTDLTIGDYWGIEEVMPDFYDSMGNSLVFIHSRRGQEVFEAVRGELEYRESRIRDCLQPNLKRPTPASGKRAAFWKDYREGGIVTVVKKYGSLPKNNRCIRQKIKSKYKKIKIFLSVVTKNHQKYKDFSEK